MNVLIDQQPQSVTHRVMRLLLTIWLVAYPVISCGPMLMSATVGGSGAAVGLGMLAGAVLFWPWIVGIIILGLLAVLTR